MQIHVDVALGLATTTGTLGQVEMSCFTTCGIVLNDTLAFLAGCSVVML